MNKKLPPLSERLKAIVSMVAPGLKTADIGCDHGYTAIWLCNSGTCPFAIASDINAGPLEKARENAEIYGARDSVGLRLGPGLGTVKPGEADCAVISGMGGLLIKEILEKSPEVVSGLSELVLSPHSDAAEVRRYLGKAGFEITDEAMVFEDGKYYPVIKAVKSDAPKALDAAELEYGPVLIAKKDETLGEYLAFRKKTLEGILGSLDSVDTASARERREDIKNDLAVIDAVLSKNPS